MLTRRQFISNLTIAGAGSLCGAASLSANAKTWPTKPIKMLVGFPAGTSTDLLARTMAEPLRLALGQTIVVENRVGAGGNIAADVLSKSSDAHTIGMVSTGPLVTAKLLNNKLPFDPDKDLVPIIMIGSAPMVLVTSNKVAGKNMAEIIASLRALGTNANYASVGVGSAAHLGMELLNTATGITATHVPYQGAPQITVALIAGDVQLALMVPAAAMPLVRAGKIRAIGVTSAKRSELVPELPPLSEAGVVGFNFEPWNAICAPESMPIAQRQRLEAELKKILANRDIEAALKTQGWHVDGATGAALITRIRSDITIMSRLIRERGIKLQS